MTMAAAGIGNAAGTVVVTDFGNPSIIGGLSRAAITSGGVFVFGSTATGVVGSGLNSFATADVLFAQPASGGQFNGIAMQTVGSNLPISVAVNGVFILQCVGSVFGGAPVGCEGTNAVTTLGSSVVPDAATNWGPAGKKIGRAVTDGASGGFAVVHINP